MKTKLSYTTMNALLHEPHTWLCKQMGLKTFSNKYMEEGKAAHRIIQDHVSGVKFNEMLTEKDVPTFSMVEQVELDEKLRVTFDIDDKYSFNGFLDGYDMTRFDMLEIKTGKSWSAGDFARLVQWKLYAIGMQGFSKIWMINTPRNPEEWNSQNIKIFNKDVTDKDKQDGHAFIQRAISVIKNIKDEKLDVEKRSSWCFYIDCPWCTKGGTDL